MMTRPGQDRESSLQAAGRPQPEVAAPRRSGRRLAPLGLCLLAALLFLAVSGCAGYRIGNETLYPCEIRTVYVPVFQSASFRRNLGERLTEAVIKEIELKTPYKVVGTSDADSVLSGRITGETKRVLVENRYDEPREVEVNLQVQAQWVDRQSHLIHPMTPVPVPSELVTITENANLVPEVGGSVATGHQQAIHRLAEQIVSMMEAPW
jgi:hypothetical protein